MILDLAQAENKHGKTQKKRKGDGIEYRKITSHVRK